jgi:hypothetical protein
MGIRNERSREKMPMSILLAGMLIRMGTITLLMVFKKVVFGLGRGSVARSRTLLEFKDYHSFSVGGFKYSVNIFN